MTGILAPPPITDFPAPPVDVFPYAVLDTPWLKASFDLTANRAKGSLMLAKTVEGDTRSYGFEVIFDGAIPRPKVSVSLDTDGFAFEKGDRFDDRKEKLAGLPKGWRRDLNDRAVRAATHLRDLALAQEQWLLDQFKIAQPVEAIYRRTGRPRTNEGVHCAVHRGWLITRYYGTTAKARRLNADGGTESLIVRAVP